MCEIGSWSNLHSLDSNQIMEIGFCFVLTENFVIWKLHHANQLFLFDFLGKISIRLIIYWQFFVLLEGRLQFYIKWFQRILFLFFISVFGEVLQHDFDFWPFLRLRKIGLTPAKVASAPKFKCFQHFRQRWQRMGVPVCT